MTNNTHAQQQGGYHAFQATFTTEVIAMLILFTFLTASQSAHVFSETIAWIGLPNLSVFILCSWLFSYWLGGKAGLGVISQSNNAYWTGCLLMLCIVLLSTLVSILLFLATQRLLNDLPGDWFMVNVVQPMVWMVCISFIPCIMAGMWYGYQLKAQTESNM